MRPDSPTTSVPELLRYIPLTYNNTESEKSAHALIFRLRPEWKHSEGKIEIVRFKDGITNTVGTLKRHSISDTQN